MPDYRVTLTMGAVRAGVSPASILPAAKAAAGEVTMVEAADIAIVAGTARITVRFDADDEEIARQIAEHVARVTAQSAEITAFRVTERRKGRWFAVN